MEGHIKMATVTSDYAIRETDKGIFVVYLPTNKISGAFGDMGPWYMSARERAELFIRALVTQ